MGDHEKKRLFPSYFLFRLVYWRTFAPATVHVDVRLAHKNVVSLVRNEYCTIQYKGMNKG